MKLNKLNIQLYTLFSFRLLLVISSILYPIVGGLYKMADNTLIDSFLHRLGFSGVCLLAYILTFTSTTIKNNISKIVIILFYILTADILHLCYLNNFNYGYLLSLIIVITAASIIFRNNKFYLIYNLFVIAIISICSFFIESSYIDKTIFITIVVISMIVTFLIFNVRLNLQKQLFFSDKIVKQANAIIIVFDTNANATFVAPQVKDVIGYNHNELLKKGWWKIMLQHSSNSYKTQQDVYKKFVDIQDDSETQLKTKVATNKGEIKWISWKVSSFDQNQILVIGSDVTVNHFQERELKQFKHIISEINSLVIVSDEKNKITWVNDSFTRITGYTFEKVIGKKAEDVLRGPQTSCETILFIEENIRKKESFHTEILNYTKQGEEIWLSINTTLVLNSQKDIVQFITVGNDITESKQNQQKMEELSIVARSTDNLVMIANKDNLITWVNGSFTDITGYELNDAINKAPRALLRNERTDKKEIEYINNQIAKKESFQAESYNYRKDGSRFWMNIVVNIILDDHGEIEKFITIGSDITEAKKNEERLSHYVKRLDIIHDLDKAILSAQSLQEIANSIMNSLLQLIPKSDRAVFYTFDHQKKTAIVIADISKQKNKERVLDDNIDYDDFYGIEKLLNGEEYYIPDIKKVDTKKPDIQVLIKQGIKSYSSHPLTYKGKLFGSIHIGSNIVHPFNNEDKEIIKEITSGLNIAVFQMKTQETIAINNVALNTKNQDLEQLNQELKQFSYIVSHDLKAPLRAIMSLADFIIKDHAENLGDDGKYQLDLMKSRILRMSHLIDGILQYSRLSKPSEISKTVNINNVLSEITKSLLIKKSTILNIQPNLPIIQADETRIQQLFQNLISNALKFADTEHPKVDISCRDADKYWEFRIQDNGIGIEKKHYDRIFQIFQTLKSRDEMENTGIGLSIVKKIVENYGGKVWVKSEIDVGSTFFFLLKK
ncbi:MAG: PAS domain S-box protein [Cyclobacteriaceae bacterium]|nr:PAS domain S-box protein [Cyclobacteriaceae bacterium]